MHRLKNSSELSEIPVIMATAKSMEYDKIKTLDMGADDYLVKPFGMLEMVSRIKAVLRRCKTPGSHVLRAAGVTLNEDEHTVAVDGERIALTYKEYELLRLFMSKPGIAFSREQLFSEIWGMDYCGETRTLERFAMWATECRSQRMRNEPEHLRIKSVGGLNYVK